MSEYDPLGSRQEHIADFVEAARGLYVQTYQEQFGRQLPPMFMDKPLRYVRLSVNSAYEHVDIKPLTTADVITMHYHPDYQDVPADTMNYHLALAERIGQAVIRPGLIIEQELPAGSVDATYVARWADRPDDFVSRFNDPAAATSLAAATAYLLRASRFIDQDTNPVGKNFDLIIDPKLSLNGHEPDTFLRDYAADMKSRILSCRQDIDQAIAAGYPGNNMEMIRLRLAEAEQAYRSATSFLR